jgi:hypothetical protein
MAKRKRKKKHGKKKHHSGKRPLSFLKKMHAKMSRNIVKLEHLIQNPDSRPR